MGERDAYDQAARSVLANYGIEDQTPKLLSISENATYRVEGPDGPLVLRVHRDGYHTKSQIESELSWSQALRAADIVSTPAVIASLPGRRVEEAVGPDGRFTHCVLFEFVDGAEPAADQIVSHFAELGSIAAAMHEFTRRWHPPAGFDRLTWNVDTILGAQPHWGHWHDGDGIDGTVRSLFTKAVDVMGHRLQDYGTSPGRFGLIHADMRLANLLVTQSGTSVIDFDDCGHSWFMYDLAAALSFIEHRDDVGEAIEQWTTGYRDISTLGHSDHSIIPTMIMLRRVLLVAWLGSHPTADIDPELRGSFTANTVDLIDRYLRHPTRWG